jgi:hypothetical protein
MTEIWCIIMLGLGFGLGLEWQHCSGGSRGGSLGSDEPPLAQIFCMTKIYNVE